MAARKIRSWYCDDDGYDAIDVHPDATRVFNVDFKQELRGNTITSISVAASGLTMTGDGYSGTVIQFTVSGVTSPYGEVTMTVNVSNGEVLVKTLRFYPAEAG